MSKPNKVAVSVIPGYFVVSMVDDIPNFDGIQKWIEVQFKCKVSRKYYRHFDASVLHVIVYKVV